MTPKIAVLLLVCCALAAASPAKPRFRGRAGVSPNPRNFKHVVKPRTPLQRRSGTWRTESCGVAQLPTSRLYHGEEAAPHSYPWQVLLVIDHGAFCNGVVISDEWILTSAGCLWGAGLVQVLFGAHNKNAWEPSQVTIESREYYQHEDYNVPNAFDNDIGLVHLPSKVEFNEYIQPVCLPTYSDVDDPFAGQIVTATGWGLSLHGWPDFLQEMEAPTLSTEECQATYGSVITDLYLCTSGEGAKGACQGDLGSPLNYVVDGRTQTRGISSFYSAAGCGYGDPTGYTRLVKFLDWIETKTGIAIDP